MRGNVFGRLPLNRQINMQMTWLKEQPEKSLQKPKISERIALDSKSFEQTEIFYLDSELFIDATRILNYPGTRRLHDSVRDKQYF